MPSGGKRPGAGRPRKWPPTKTEVDIICERRKTVASIFKEQGLSEEPSYWLDEKAREIYADVYKWLKSVGCTDIVLPCHLEEYAHFKSRWFECEQNNIKTGMAIKDENGNIVPSPFVAISAEYLKQASSAWNKIYAVVRTAKLMPYDKVN